MTRALSRGVPKFTIPSIFLRIAPILARFPQAMQPGTFNCTDLSAAKALFSNSGIPIQTIRIDTTTATAVLLMIISPSAAFGTADFRFFPNLNTKIAKIQIKLYR